MVAPVIPDDFDAIPRSVVEENARIMAARDARAAALSELALLDADLLTPAPFQGAREHE